MKKKPDVHVSEKDTSHVKKTKTHHCSRLLISSPWFNLKEIFEDFLKNILKNFEEFLKIIWKTKSSKKFCAPTAFLIPPTVIMGVPCKFLIKLVNECRHVNLPRTTHFTGGDIKTRTFYQWSVEQVQFFM